MADPEVETPRLSPMAGPEARVEFVRELKALVDEIEKMQKSLELMYQINSDLKELKGNHQNLRKEVVDTNVAHEKKLDALHYASDENRRKLAELVNESKAYSKESKELFREACVAHEVRCAGLEKDYAQVLAKIADFGAKCDQVNANASQKVNVAYSELNKKLDDMRKLSDANYEKLLKEQERVAFQLERVGHRDESDVKRLDILEMQVERMDLGVKELKVKVGV